MRFICVLLLFILSYPLFSGIAPQSALLGSVDVNVEKESNAETLIKAFREEYTEEWLNKYTSGDEKFALMYTEQLSRILPMKNIIMGVETRDSISFYSHDRSVLISATFKDGKIIALDFNQLAFPSDQEAVQSIL